MNNFSNSEQSPIGILGYRARGHEAPRLRYIFKALELLKPHTLEDGTKQRWDMLSETIPPYSSALELTSSVRAAVNEWVSVRIPLLDKKPTVRSINQFTSTSLREAITEGWFEGLKTEIEDLKTETDGTINISGQRREVLLAVMGHVSRTIETKIYCDILTKATPDELVKLGLDENTRQLTIDLLDASRRADPLFIRYMAYAGKSGTPPNEATADSLHLPNDPDSYTIRQLFPKETHNLSQKFLGIAEKGGAWVSLPGGQSFQEYLKVTSQYYGETDPTVAQELREKANKLYVQYIKEGFPIILTGPSDESVKAPYLDPELKVSLRTKEAQYDEASWKNVQNAYADSLGDLGIESEAVNLRKPQIVGSVVLGGYGVNLVFDAVAQENPTIGIYIDSQIKNFDAAFPNKWMRKYIHGVDAAFAQHSPEQARSLMEYMSRTNTVQHELTHWIFPEGSDEAEKFGNGPTNRKMQEIKAELLYRAQIPQMIEAGALEGTVEEWAMATTATALQMLESGDETDDYFRAAAFSLHDLFDQDVLMLQDDKIVINDADKYFEVIRNQAQEIIDLHKDPMANEKKAKQWIQNRCVVHPELRKIIDLL